MSSETVIDIVERLGVVDLVIERLRARIEDVDEAHRAGGSAQAELTA